MAPVVCSRFSRVLLIRATFSEEKQLIGVVHQHVHARHQIATVIHQPGNGRGRCNDCRQIAVLALERRTLWRAAAELDDRSPGDPGQRQFGLGVFFDRSVSAQANPRQHPARIIRVQAQHHHVADLDPAVLHGATVGQAADRLVEDDFVILEFGIDTGLGQPQTEEQGACHHYDGEQADQYVMGSGFHVRPR